MSPLFLHTFLAKGPCSIQACHVSSLFLRPFSKTSLFNSSFSYHSYPFQPPSKTALFSSSFSHAIFIPCQPSTVLQGSKASLLSTSARQIVPVRLTRFGKMSLYHSPINFGNTVLFAHHFGKSVCFLHPSRKKPLAIHPRFLTFWQSLLLASPIRRYFYFFIFFKADPFEQ